MAIVTSLECDAGEMSMVLANVNTLRHVNENVARLSFEGVDITIGTLDGSRIWMRLKRSRNESRTVDTTDNVVTTSDDTDTIVSVSELTGLLWGGNDKKRTESRLTTCYALSDSVEDLHDNECVTDSESDVKVSDSSGDIRRHMKDCADRPGRKPVPLYTTSAYVSSYVTAMTNREILDLPSRGILFVDVQFVPNSTQLKEIASYHMDRWSMYRDDYDSDQDMDWRHIRLHRDGGNHSRVADSTDRDQLLQTLLNVIKLYDTVVVVKGMEKAITLHSLTNCYVVSANEFPSLRQHLRNNVVTRCSVHCANNGVCALAHVKLLRMFYCELRRQRL